MAAITSSQSPPPSSITASLGRARSVPSHLSPPLLRPWPRRSLSRHAVSSALYSPNPSSSSGSNGSLGDPSSSSSSYSGVGEVHHGLGLPPPPSRGAPVFVTLPVDAVAAATGRMARAKTMGASFMALAAAGVEGVVVEFWWGIVERDAPGVYDWGGYMDLVILARRYGLKVRVVLAFHQFGTGPDAPCWLPLPRWVLEEMDKDPDLAYSDRFGRRNREYISLGCDILPVLRGRSPIQVYSDFMRSFKDTFRDLLGVIVTEIQVGMGPAGELRYPSCPSEKLTPLGSVPKHGEFQCYDKYMLGSLNASAQAVGMREWGNDSPLGPINLLQDSENTSFFRNAGSWNTAHGRFFLEWYSGMLLLHGERLCMAAKTIFWNTGVKVSAKVAGIHWHYSTDSHPSELTAGYYNTLIRDGYLPIARMFGRYIMTLCCTCFDMRDAEQSNSKSSPEGHLRQLVYAARMCNLPLSGENSVTRLDDTSLKQVIKNSRLYFNGALEPSLSFNYVRMNRNLFDPRNWTQFTRFVRQMSDARTFQAKLDFRRTMPHLCVSS